MSLGDAATARDEKVGKPTMSQPLLPRELAKLPLPGASECDARRRSRKRRGRLVAFMAPSFVLVFGLFIVPLLLNVGFAFADYTSFSRSMSWAGLDNFRTLLDQEILVNAIRVTVSYALIAMLVQNTVSLILAIAMQRTTRLIGFFRSAYFLPVLISPLAAGYIWAAIVSPTGPLNSFISTLISDKFDYSWLGHPFSALATVAFIDAWKWSGLITLVYIAGLNAIPTSLLEAAAIDGASTWRRFWSIKFPLLAPAITFNVVVTFVGAFSAYDIVVATTQGGPGNATRVLNVAMQSQYGQGFFGTASALSAMVTVLVVVTAIPLVTWLRRREVYG